MRKRHYRRIVALALLSAGLLLMLSWLPMTSGAPTVSAHAFVIGSDPVDGSTITTPPPVVRIYFDAPISTASQASVYAFTPGSSNKLLVSANQGTRNATNPKELDIALLPANRLPQGGYEVSWTALSLTDGRTTSGLIGFNLGFSNTGTTGIPTLGPTTSNYFPQLSLSGLLAVAWDWLVMLALLFWTGMLITETFIIPRILPQTQLAQVHKQARSLHLLCLAGLFVGEIINLILRATTLSETLGQNGIEPAIVKQIVLSTNYGYFWLARMVFLIIVLLLYWWGAREKRSEGDAAAAPSLSRASKHFRRLRLQIRGEADAPGQGDESLPALPLLSRTQARVSGAVAVNITQSRSTGPAPTRAVTASPSEEASRSPSSRESLSRLVLAGLIMLTLVLSNEIIQLTPVPITATLLNWLGLLAQAAWFGCIACFSFILWPLISTTDPDYHTGLLIDLLKRIRSLVLAAGAILLVCALFLNESTIQTPGQLLSDPYGRALLGQDVLLGAIVVLTGYLLFLLLPRLRRQATLLPIAATEMPARRTRRFKLEKTQQLTRRTLYTLSGLAATLLICTALMNFFAPPVVFPDVNYTSAGTSTTPASPASQTQTAGGLSVTFEISPARVGGTNTLTFTLKDTHGQVVENATVKVSLNMPVMDMGEFHVTIPGGKPTYTSIISPYQSLNMAGVWTVQVEIDRPDQPPVHLTFQTVAT